MVKRPPLTTEEARVRLGIPRSTFLRYVARGIVQPLHKLPGTGGYLFDAGYIEELREQRRRPETTPTNPRLTVPQPPPH